jgi:hypothetical protein
VGIFEDDVQMGGWADDRRQLPEESWSSAWREEGAQRLALELARRPRETSAGNNNSVRGHRSASRRHLSYVRPAQLRLQAQHDPAPKL